MNRLFLLIPAVSEKDAGADIAYLKLLNQASIDDIIGFVRKIRESDMLISKEGVQYVYDEVHLRELYHAVNDSPSNVNEMPQMENLLTFLNDAVGFCSIGHKLPMVVVNGMQVPNGLLNLYLCNRSLGEDALLNDDALNGKSLELLIDGKHVNEMVLPCNREDIYCWLVQHRSPERKLDENYKKHTDRCRLGKAGVPISALTYSKQDTLKFLRRAITADIGASELYFYDKNEDKFIVFWNENLSLPTFHAFEVSAENKSEIQKIYKRGGRDLMCRIETVSDIKFAEPE